MQAFINAFRRKKPKPTEIPGQIQVFLYKNKELKLFPFDSDITCEDICISCCKSLNILPATRLLFGLRVVDSEEWLFPCKRPETFHQYEFRMRFKVPESDDLFTIDSNAYDYLYFQIRHDMVNDRIDEIKFPNFKSNVLGLGVVDMYIDYAENRGSKNDIQKNFKKYLPAKIIRKHPYFARKKILFAFQKMCKTTKKLMYVKSSYMHSFAEIAPNYLKENFNAIVESLPDGGDQTENSSESYPVAIDLDLYGDGGPSIKVSLFKTQWILLTTLEDLNALYLDKNQLGVDLDINGYFRRYHLEFKNSFMSKSFMSYVTGYSRLMTKWMFDPCVHFPTPSLMELKDINCHGPVGGDFSYAKIREKSKGPGTFIVRQCESQYDTYFIDIIGTREQPETFKITKDHSKWYLHTEGIESFPNLLDLARAIPIKIECRYHQIPVSDYDKPPLLLICVPRNLLPRTTDNVITHRKLLDRPLQIFNARTDIQIYERSLSRSACGQMWCYLAEWVQPNRVQNIKVTLKILEDKKADFKDLMKLSHKWNGIRSADFIKMYGLTLTAPYALIVEHAEHGPLDKFLFLKRNIPFRCLLDLANGLVRAVAFMQEKRIYHGYIRCSSLMVTDFCPEKNLVIAKLADPGMPRKYDSQDIPWIPTNLDYRNDYSFDFYSELWASATTMWEIFSRGEPIINMTAEQRRENRRDGGILKMGEDWPDEIIQIIMNGWSLDKNRFDKMDILKKLSNLQPDSEMNPPYIDDEIISDTTTSYNYGIENPCDYNTFNGTVQIINEGKLINKRKIGQGHYGCVYQGELHYCNGKSVEVAIKVLRDSNKANVSVDFNREIMIMQGLNHPNIVRIITFTYDTPMSIVMEYLNGRSLKDYLQHHKPTLNNEKLLKVSLQISKGMEYLTEKNIIHRDLAARNILVDGENVKISDFGLAQHANSNGYIKEERGRYIPISWYALESLIEFKFSTWTDVWSYGVTLYEIFSRGDDPYLEGLNINMPNYAPVFIDRLQKGDRLKKPELCPQIVYEKIMEPCWHEERKNRRSFTEIINIINQIQNEYNI